MIELRTKETSQVHPSIATCLLLETGTDRNRCGYKGSLIGGKLHKIRFSNDLFRSISSSNPQPANACGKAVPNAPAAPSLFKSRDTLPMLTPIVQSSSFRPGPRATGATKSYSQKHTPLLEKTAKNDQLCRLVRLLLVRSVRPSKKPARR